jgi:hypothetical protein
LAATDGFAAFLDVAIVPREMPWLAEHPGGAAPSLVWLEEVRFAKDEGAKAEASGGDGEDATASSP